MAVRVVADFETVVGEPPQRPSTGLPASERFLVDVHARGRPKTRVLPRHVQQDSDSGVRRHPVTLHADRGGVAVVERQHHRMGSRGRSRSPEASSAVVTGT